MVGDRRVYRFQEKSLDWQHSVSNEWVRIEMISRLKSLTDDLAKISSLILVDKVSGVNMSRLLVASKVGTENKSLTRAMNLLNFQVQRPEVQRFRRYLGG